MLRFALLFNLLLCPLVLSKRRQHKDSGGDDLGGHLVTALRNDVNIDLPVDEEYEDLRAELLAYHTALASITSGRRSMKTTPCWQLGGICVDHKLCEGHRFLTEVPGCKTNLEVCCFTWNNYHVRDMTDKGLDILALPWSKQHEFGGKGIIGPHSDEKKIRKKHKKHDKYKHHGTHQEKKHHEKNLHDNSAHDMVHYDDHDIETHHKKIHHDSEAEHENSPLVVILRTKK